MQLSSAQEVFHNSGHLKLFENAAMGLHIDLINDGSFDENLGLVGFFGENDPLTVSGTFQPIFHDMEVMVAHDLILEVGVGVTHNANLILGDIMTPRMLSDITLEFANEAFYAGQSDSTKIDGYATIVNKKNFMFPVGYGNELRPLLLLSDEMNTSARCAYFYEDPNFPSTFDQSFDTDQKATHLGDISTTEFWRLEGSISSTIQISWNDASNIGSITNEASSILIVGWSKVDHQWVGLGISQSVGNLTAGFAISKPFVPDDYEILTFATAKQPFEILDLGNYLVTPNGDGINDTLIFEGLEKSPNNTVQIYNRYGQKVFEKDNYTNDFRGLASTRNIVINRNEGLPSGVYFYLAKLHDLKLEIQGYLYLTRKP